MKQNMPKPLNVSWILLKTDETPWREVVIPVNTIQELVKTLFIDKTAYVQVFNENDKEWVHYWYDEFFPQVAKNTKILKYCKIYEMPWGEVLVRYKTSDDYDSIKGTISYQNKEEYNKSVML